MKHQNKHQTTKKFEKVISQKSFSLLLPFFRKVFFENSFKLTLISILSAINGFVTTAISISAYNLILNMTDNSDQKNYSEKILSYLKNYVDDLNDQTIFLTLIFIYCVILIIILFYSSNLITQFIIEYKKKILEKVIKINFKYFSINNAGDIGYVYQACVSRCANYPSQISRLIYNFIIIIFFLIILFKISYIMLSYFFIILSFFLFIYFLINKIAIIYNKKYIYLYNLTNTKIYELIDSIKLISQIKDYAIYENKFIVDINNVAKFVRKYFLFTSSIVHFFNYSLIFILLCLVFYFHKFSLETDKNILTFSVSGLILLKVFQSFLTNITSVLKIAVNYEEIDRILNLSERPKVSTHKRTEKINIQTLSFKNVSFRYEKKAGVILDNINLKFKKGKSYLIYGKSGTGKSTLFNLIYNFYTPNKGLIEINDKNILNKVTNDIGYLTQDHFFINDNIFENLKLFKNDLTIEMAKSIIKDVDLDLPLSKKVGNQGKKISGGQKTKIALARILLNNPQILLVDESLSSIDKKSRSKILFYLKKIKRNMIQIFISHEIFKNSSFDQILNLNEGKIFQR